MSSLDSKALNSTEHTPLLDTEETTLVNKKKETINDLKPYIGSIIASFYMTLMAGLNNGSIGAIIPRLKEYYDIPNETVSLLFLCGACGSLTSAGLNGALVYYFGQLKTIYISAFTLLLSYIFLIMRLPFPVMGLLLFCAGLAISLSSTASNVYLASLPMSSMLLNTAHALFGLGAMISPLIATLLLQYDFSWKGIYIYLALFASLNIVLITFGFWSVTFNSGDDDMVKEEEETDNTNGIKLNHSQLVKRAIFNRMTLLGTVYVLINTGIESTAGSWGYTFLTEGRFGDKIHTGKVISVFWVSLSCGKIILGHLANRFGERLMITLFTILAIMSFIITIVSSDIILNSIALVSAGFLLAPMFPITVAIASRVLPRSYHATSIGFISSLGPGGATLFPFLAGQIIGKYGILIMPGVCVGMTVIMMIFWPFIPSKKHFFEECK